MKHPIDIYKLPEMPPNIREILSQYQVALILKNAGLVDVYYQGSRKEQSLRYHKTDHYNQTNVTKALEPHLKGWIKPWLTTLICKQQLFYSCETKGNI